MEEERLLPKNSKEKNSLLSGHVFRLIIIASGFLFVFGLATKAFERVAYGASAHISFSAVSASKARKAIDFALSTPEYAGQINPGEGYAFLRPQRFVEPGRGEQISYAVRTMPRYFFSFFHLHIIQCLLCLHRNIRGSVSHINKHNNQRMLLLDALRCSFEARWRRV